MPVDPTGKYRAIIVVKQDGTLLPDDEPVFVLRAQDILAPAALMQYADLYEAVTGDSHHAGNIRDFARVMTTWEPRKLPDHDHT